MALPHLKINPYTYKNNYESSQAKRRNFDEQYRQQWNDKVKYFQESDVHANKVSQWSSEKSFKNSIDAYNKQLTSRKGDDNRDLPLRKTKLADLFETERLQYQSELEKRLLNDVSSISVLKNRAEVLKSAREEERRQQAEERFHEHFRLNNPELRKVEREIINKDVTDFWPVQIQTKNEEEIRAKEEERRYEDLESIKLKIAKEEERENFQKKVLQERYMKDSLRRQIDEIKRKEEESKILKSKEADLLKVEHEMDEFYGRRKLINEAQARKDYGRTLLRQHAAVMRRKCQQIQEELESDIQFLSYLTNKDEEENEIQSARKQTARQDIEWMREMIEDQLRKERERESELDCIFAEEAARLWTRREKEWNKEKMAREKLMEEVLKERKLQMQQKLNATRERQADSLREREQLLREMETDRHDLVRETEVAQQRRSQFRSALDHQVTERRMEEAEQQNRRRHELDEDLDAEKDYERLLQEEAERMRSLGITPRSARR